MEIERNYKAMAYTITIPREEMKSLFIESRKETDCTKSVDDIVADKLSEKIVALINSDLKRG